MTAHCIDERLLLVEFGLELKFIKDKSQRTECQCMVSKDIGQNNTCLAGCQYCYATLNHQAAINNFKQHDAGEPFLIKK